MYSTDAIVCIAIFGCEKKKQPGLKHMWFLNNEVPWNWNAWIKGESSGINN